MQTWLITSNLANIALILLIYRVIKASKWLSRQQSPRLRQALRIYAAQHPHQRQFQVKDWFETEFERTIILSSISKNLSNKYQHLDTPLRTQKLQQQRVKPIKRSDLIRAQINWYRELEQALKISGDLIKQKAMNFSTHLDCYQGVEVPTFINGWLDAFKNRDGIKV